jgi:hypothetical protein
MSMNPALTEMVAQTRMADMQRAIATAANGGQRAARPRAGVRPEHVRTRVVFAATARHAMGWFLVGVGLRLAVPRPRSTLSR